MKFFPAFPLLVVFLLVFSTGTILVKAEECSNAISIVNCTKLACVERCVSQYGKSINGGCIDDDNCCCYGSNI
ncbi:hypothetical protein I3843_08G004400 [Carya illinoinensis]|uniref:Uncharacterized protein n=1 Tax=Carya illinoinensis TaxID=32201 RepID=A0A922J941_CARIL|nr:hypothetical protein I3760_08G004000 [Carya illinoinensis]KAG6698078.1 hypothetical protein I3842_08G004000 [Carya illinoinensis]KAG7965489.1 hypothetical protein I3843_08G004400 [Carya illinoinensis]